LAPVVAGETPTVRQVVYIVPRAHKVNALVRVLQAEDPRSALIFCGTRVEVDQLSALLPDKGLSAAALHGGLDQSERDRVMKRFKSGAVRLLIATDVAARGLDIDHLALVVNYEAPTSPEVYVHRIGRTGRAGRAGTAITLIEPSQVRFIKSLERATGGALIQGQVPDAAHLKAQRFEKTKTRVLEAAKNGAGEALEAWVKESGLQPWQLAAAAVTLLHEEHFGDASVDEIDIPVPRASLPKQRPQRAARRGDDEKVTLFVGAGAEAGIRPGDLVGAIANEAQIDSKHIGPIQIRDRFSLVGVPADSADHIIAVLNSTKIRGRKAKARRER
jgi:ATP-dependent RNA helicase DeaD